jgi:hypothetical protein
MPLIPIFVTLQIPHLLVHVQHKVLASLRKIPERGRAAQLRVGRTATAQRVTTGTERIIIHAYVQLLARLLQREKPREDRRVTFGGHATVVIESEVTRNGLR